MTMSKENTSITYVSVCQFKPTFFPQTVGEKIDTIQRNTKAPLDASKEVGLEVNPEIIK
jgi:hypothetical protein